MTPLLLDWHEGPGRSYGTIRDGVQVTVYYGTAQGGCWWVMIESLWEGDEDERPFGQADLEGFQVSLAEGFPELPDAQRAAEALFFRARAWFDREEVER